MDNTFPSQLFPNFYLDGPPDEKLKHCYGGWGTYERVLAVNTEPYGVDPASIQHVFVSQHTLTGEKWVPLKPAVTPLILPNKDAKVSSSVPPHPLDFPEHMKYFYTHHYMDAFSTMGHLLEDSISFNRKRRKGDPSMGWAYGFVKRMKYQRCEVASYSKKIRHLHHMLSNDVSDVPLPLLGSLLHEELKFQREEQRFHADSTGGALAYVPLHESRDYSDGCLIYPSALDELTIHRVAQRCSDDEPPSFIMDSKPFVYALNGAIRQISLGSMEEECSMALRSDYFCGAWIIGDGKQPRLKEVIQTKDRFSCVNISPHLPNEFAVVNERGAAYLWTVGNRLQKFREEDSNLYFNAKCPWRWCEFSCHPRVMVYADRTGAELTDIRCADSNHTFFRIGKTASCMSGERVILTKYLSNTHTHHHLINTQLSTYIMDERVPSVPMLKWDHMMVSPPMFACELPAQSESQTSKLLLGAQRSQELMLLQYTGGREHVCQAQGPIQKLLSPNEALNHLNHLLPHRKYHVRKRLNVPAAGFTAVQKKDYLSVFQLTETGDIFYHSLKLHTDQTASSNNTPEQSVVGQATVGTCEGESVRSHTDSAAQPVQSDSVDKDASGTNENIRKEPPNQSTLNNPTCSARPSEPDLQDAWDKWFEPIFKNIKKRRPNYERIKTSDLRHMEGGRLIELKEDRFLKLRKDLQEVMKKKETLIHGVTYLPHLDVKPVPGAVNLDDWPDDVSQRLAASWEGHWMSWWEERLGLNRDKKIAALRRKRQRQKQARARSRTSLSGSFTRSVSYQESVSGLSSVGSQYLGSGEEMEDSTSHTDMEAWRARSEIHRKSPIILRRFLNEQSTAETPQDLLSSPSKSQSFIQVERPICPSVASVMDLGPPASLPLIRPVTIQLKRLKESNLSSIPTSQKQTQDSAPDSGPSKSRPRLSPTPSHRSLSSQRLSQLRNASQASQPKKKSRMGF